MNKKKKLEIIDYILIVIFAFAMLIWIPVLINGGDQTQKHFLGFGLHHVMSDSMEPTIMTGDYLVSYKTDFNKIRVGDIIVYRHDFESGEYKAIVHRVISKTDEYIKTKGDNNETEDPWNVYPKDVRFKVFGVE